MISVWVSTSICTDTWWCTATAPNLSIPNNFLDTKALCIAWVCKVLHDRVTNSLLWSVADVQHVIYCTTFCMQAVAATTANVSAIVNTARSTTWESGLKECQQVLCARSWTTSAASCRVISTWTTRAWSWWGRRSWWSWWSACSQELASSVTSNAIDRNLGPSVTTAWASRA